MTRKAFLFAICVIGAATAQAQPAPTPPTAKPDKGQDKVICRFINTTGSRLLGERICKTRAEWDRDSDTTREIFESTARQPSADQTPINPN